MPSSSRAFARASTPSARCSLTALLSSRVTVSISAAPLIRRVRAASSATVASSKRDSRIASRESLRKCRSCICASWAFRNGSRGLSGSIRPTRCNAALASSARLASKDDSASLSNSLTITSALAGAGARDSNTGSASVIKGVPAIACSTVTGLSEPPKTHQPSATTTTRPAAPMPRILGLENEDSAELPVADLLESWTSVFLLSENAAPTDLMMRVTVSMRLLSSSPNALDKRSLIGDARFADFDARTALGSTFTVGIDPDVASAGGVVVRIGLATDLDRMAPRRFALAIGALAADLKAESGASRWCLTDASIASRARPGDTGFNKNRYTLPRLIKSMSISPSSRRPATIATRRGTVVRRCMVTFSTLPLTTAASTTATPTLPLRTAASACAIVLA